MRLHTFIFLFGTIALVMLGEMALSQSIGPVSSPEGLAGAAASPVAANNSRATAVSSAGSGGAVAPPTQQPIAATPTWTPVPPTPTPKPPVKVGSADPPVVSAESAVVVDGKSGAVLYAKNADLEVPPASTTKIVTALVALERGNPADQVTVQFDSSELYDSTLMGIRVGDVVTLEDLLYGLMLPSGNDAALAIANHIAGSEEEFVKLMNQKAAELGLKHSHFQNPHGLDEDGHYSSAADMVAFARYGMERYPLFVQLSAAKTWAVGGSRPFEVYNLNQLLWRYPGADGVKIGFTDLALRTIVASATRDGHRVFVGLMRSQDLWSDSPPLFDYAFDNFQWPE